jgi:hypothetical protein
MAIKTEGGLLLKEWTANATRGLNYSEYNLGVDEAQVKAYREEWVKAKRGNPVAGANKTTYLQPGKYSLEIAGTNGASFKQSITITPAGRGQFNFEPEAENEPEEPGETK